MLLCALEEKFSFFASNSQKPNGGEKKKNISWQRDEYVKVMLELRWIWN
jgi:hypothetical protein